MKSFFIAPLLATVFAWATSSEGLTAQRRMMDCSKCERPGTLGRTGWNPSIIQCVCDPYFCSLERVAISQRNCEVRTVRGVKPPCCNVGKSPRHMLSSCAVCVPWKSASVAVNTCIRFAEERLILVDSDADERGRDSTRDPISGAWIGKSGKCEHEGKSLDSDNYWTRCPREMPERHNATSPEATMCQAKG